MCILRELLSLKRKSIEPDGGTQDYVLNGHFNPEDLLNSAYAHEDIMNWGESQEIDYVFDLASNPR